MRGEKMLEKGLNTHQFLWKSILIKLEIPRINNFVISAKMACEFKNTDCFDMIFCKVEKNFCRPHNFKE